MINTEKKVFYCDKCHTTVRESVCGICGNQTKEKPQIITKRK